jgi:hypothetical protein
LEATKENAELELKRFTERSIWITHEIERLKLTTVVKSYVNYWPKISADEVGIILKIPLGFYKKRLKFHEVRRIIKKIIWKTALYVIKNKLVFGFEFVCSKQLLFFYRFCSCGRKKKENRFQQVKNRLIYEIYKNEKMIDQRWYIYDEQFDFIRRFQIRELFWDTEADSTTNNFRAEVWNNLNMQHYNRITISGS